MSNRKIGNYKNPETGEKDWLEPNTVSNIVLNPFVVNVLNQDEEVAIDFTLDCIDSEKIITLTAEFENSKDPEITHHIKSEPIKMDELKFADQIAHQIYSYELIDEAPVVQEAKEETKKDIFKKLLEKGIIAESMDFKGLGFIMAKDKRAMTIETLKISVTDKHTAEVELKDCVGNVLLENLSEPKIVFFVDGNKVSIEDFSIKTKQEKTLKNYTLNSSNVIVTALEPEDQIEYEKIEFDHEDEESIENFIANRKIFLQNDNTEEKVSLEERFADLL